MFAVNVFGLISLTQLLIKDFKDRNSGHIINIGSVAGREAYAGGSIYCATKHAVSAFNGSLLREVVDTPIRVTEIQPGTIYCPILGSGMFTSPLLLIYQTGMVETGKLLIYL
jgi:3-hydroxy acid dehydrogenase/malonic semialdehyde reductase